MDLVILSGLRACDYILIAVGFSLVFGTCRVLNLMHGSFVMLGAYAAYGYSTALLARQIPLRVAVPAGVLLAAGTVAILGYVVFVLLQVTRRSAPLHVLAISVAANLFVAKVMSFLYGTEGISVPPVLRGTMILCGVAVPRGEVLVPVAVVVCVPALWYWLQHTRTGTALRAVADDQEVATLSGVKSDRLLAVTVGVSAFMAGLAGALRAPGLTLAPDMWVHPLLVAFAVVVFGGRGSLLAAVLSASLLAIAETTVSWFWSEAAAQYVALLVIVVGLFIFPRGLARGGVHDVR